MLQFLTSRTRPIGLSRRGLGKLQKPASESPMGSPLFPRHFTHQRQQIIFRVAKERHPQIVGL